jgi:SpoVK/Ycf46/Vps4 family AAA+-type ATPase
MSYSETSTKVIEIAKKLAMQYGASQVEDIHIVGAYARIDSSSFTKLFKDDREKIEASLKSSKSSEPFSNAISTSTEELLKTIESQDDLLEIVRNIVANITNSNSDDASTLTKKQTANGGNKRAIKSVQLVDTKIIHDISMVTDIDIEQIRSYIFNDVSLIAKRILSDQKGHVSALSKIQKSLGFSDLKNFDNENLSPIFDELLQANSDSSGLLARKVAETYVEIGLIAALNDGIITAEENHEIDIVKNELKVKLGNALRQPSPSRVHFKDSFSGLIGLTSVQDELSKFIDHLSIQIQRKAAGLEQSRQSMHLAFLGDPGTGKTEVARRYAEVLKNLGFLKTGQLIEVDRSDLVGKYIGTTEARTLRVIEKAKGGVLFIDEAYSLVDGREQKGYGEEAVDTLVRSMENQREQFVVILAGYIDPINKLLDMNEGLRSRVPTKIIFPPYSDEELVEIFRQFAIRSGMSIDPKCDAILYETFKKYSRQKGFGGARGARNILEESIRRQSTRIAELGVFATLKDLTVIEADDIPTNLTTFSKNRKIGFEPS